jgi:YD repeat-containing protein
MMQTQGPSGSVQTVTYTATVNVADWPTAQSANGVRTSYDYDGAGPQRTQTILNGVTPITNTL